jgi:ADP-ribose pyrophosphatase YjhB (NUDIX family)
METGNIMPTITAKSGRQFATVPASVGAVIIRDDERMLMLASPTRPGKWEPVNGAYDGNETILEALYREIREEAGEQIRTRPLCAIHATTFRYDESVPYMISIFYLMVYEGGEVVPGDDMQGSEVRWMSVEEIESEDYEIIVPVEQLWIYRRAVDLYRVLKDAPEVQQEAPKNRKNKYGD